MLEDVDELSTFVRIKLGNHSLAAINHIGRARVFFPLNFESAAVFLIRI